MQTGVFDALDYFEKLKGAGVPEAQARIQADALRGFSLAQAAGQEAASKADIQDVRLEMKAMEMRLLKWQFGVAVALAAIMAKGFGWLGF